MSAMSISRGLFCSPTRSHPSTYICPTPIIKTSHSHFTTGSNEFQFKLSFSEARTTRRNHNNNNKFMICLSASGSQSSCPSLLEPKLSPSPEVLKIWHDADAVCFDVDSTVCEDEGIDELAKFCGAGDAVAAWTTRAMGGSVLFEEALAARLSLIQPSIRDVTKFIQEHPPRLNSGIKELVEKLRVKGVDVYLVSGGFRQMIEPVADILGVPRKNIFANKLLFDDDTGNYVGYDPNEPTSRSGGKPAAVAKIKKEHGYKTMVMIGDGATDLEARQPGGAEAFICYGGIQLRQNVAVASDWLVMNFDELISKVSKSTRHGG